MTSPLRMSAPARGGAPSPELDLSPFPLDRLVAGCVENLERTYLESEGLFPYSTRLRNGALVNRYDHPQAPRYTITSLLGLAEAARQGVGVPAERVAAMTNRFLASGHGRSSNLADNGLLALHLTESGHEDGVIEALVDSLAAALDRGVGGKLDLQTLSWIAWGASAAARHGHPTAERVARSAAATIEEYHVAADCRLPRHSPRRYRRSIVSFGSVTYFLRAAHELSRTFDEQRWGRRFRDGVEWALEQQGPQGQWPWLMDTQSGLPVDTYPVFSVHQDSMAMLFLLPSLAEGTEGVAPAIERSLAWGFGANELGVDFYLTDPFVAYRSIERTERAPRARRYGRSLGYAIHRRPSRFAAARTRVNDECRSYHLGWILYVWSERAAQRSAAGES